jgi:hypothetical protein
MGSRSRGEWSGTTLRHDIPALPPELDLLVRLSDAKLGAYADALEWQIAGSEGIEPFEAPLIGHGVAVVCGRAFAAYGAAKLYWIGHLASTIDGQAWEAFADSAAAALRANTDHRTAFVDFLSEIIREANEAPDRVTETPARRVSMASLVDAFAANGSFHEVWYADSAPVLFRWSDAFEVLRRVEPDRFLQLIDELPHPALVGQCLGSRALIENPEDVLQLLRSARVAFDTEERWQRNGMAAILLLQMASVHLLSAGDTPTRGAAGETPSAMPTSSQADAAEDLREGIVLFRSALGMLMARRRSS